MQLSCSWNTQYSIACSFFVSVVTLETLLGPWLADDSSSTIHFILAVIFLFRDPISIVAVCPFAYAASFSNPSFSNIIISSLNWSRNDFPSTLSKDKMIEINQLQSC